MKTVLITHAFPEDTIEPLKSVAHVIQGPIGPDLMSRSEVLQHVSDVDGIINQGELRVDAELLDAAPKLKIVANASLGTDNLNLAALTERGIWATNILDAFVDSTADCTMGLILGLARRIVEADSYVRSGLWKAFQPGAWDGLTLAGQVLGLVGYGRIGQAVATRARAFGMKIIWNSLPASADPEYRTLDDLLRESDFVSLHVPLTQDTHHLLNAQRLSSMKKGAYLINMARGQVVEEAALARVLEEGHLAGAGLDVFENEPQVHPSLITNHKAILTPHFGGGTRQARRAARLLSIKNVAAVLSGDLPLSPVNRPALSELGVRV